MQKVGTRVTVEVGRRGECFLMENEDGPLEEIQFQLAIKHLRNREVAESGQSVYISTSAEAHGQCLETWWTWDVQG